MSGSGLHAYAPLLLHLLLAIGLAGALTAVSVLIGWRRPNRAKLQAYECGMEPTGDAREPFSVKFYLVAVVFILFDVEAIFLYPWAYIFRRLRWYGFAEMMIYIAILLVGYLYLWKKGARDWHKQAAHTGFEIVTESSSQNTNVVAERLRAWNSKAVAEVIQFR